MAGVGCAEPSQVSMEVCQPDVKIPGGEIQISLCKQPIPGCFDFGRCGAFPRELEGYVTRGEWAAFARAYNGPSYWRHGYHTKLARAYRRHGGS